MNCEENLMKNVKGFAIANDGNMKRIAITYDDIDETGKIINPSMKLNRVIVDDNILKSVNALFDYAESII